jgi:hypothetical protein
VRELSSAPLPLAPPARAMSHVLREGARAVQASGAGHVFSASATVETGSSACAKNASIRPQASRAASGR